MVFSSTEFLCFFLPIVLMLYYLCRRNRTLSNVVLTVMSLLFYAWGEPTFVLVMLASIFINWLAARVIDGNRERPRARKLALIAGLVLDVGMLAVFKYLSFFVRNLNGELHRGRIPRPRRGAEAFSGCVPVHIVLPAADRGPHRAL